MYFSIRKSRPGSAAMTSVLLLRNLRSPNFHLKDGEHASELLNKSFCSNNNNKDASRLRLLLDFCGACIQCMLFRLLLSVFLSKTSIVCTGTRGTVSLPHLRLTISWKIVATAHKTADPPRNQGIEPQPA